MERVYLNMSYAIHGDVCSSSRIRILSSHYLLRHVKCPLRLSCWFQITAVDIILPNWSIWTSSK
jgi:hypothetical protein